MKEDCLVVLPNRAVKQPKQTIQAGGDCGACCVAGIMGIAVADVYTKFSLDPIKDNLGYYRMKDVLYAGLAEDLDRIIVDPCVWPPNFEKNLTYGASAVNSSLEWFAYVRMALDAGYYGLAEVCFARNGGDTDHWVLIVGSRELHPPSGVGTIKTQILVSCSASSTPIEEWVDVQDFLKNRGGFNIFFARPIKKDVTCTS